MRATDLVARVRPHLAVLARETGEDAGLSVPDGYQVHYIDQVGSDHPVQVRDWTGELVPMHTVPSGLVILAYWPDEALDRYLRRPLQRFTATTMTDPDELRKRLGQIRTDRFAWVFEEFAEGINSVAAPVLDPRGRPMAALHVHGPAYRFPPEDRMLDIAALVAQKAALVAEQLGAHPIS
jgi:DNA-binding IclR family transcriptional regulator